MLKKTNYTVDQSVIDSIDISNFTSMKTAINQPVGNFFYDSWTIKSEFKGTIFESLLESLPVDKGEARIIVLESGQCYSRHSDIDDRWHLNLWGDQGYLIDLEELKMHHMVCDKTWYDMDAGKLHSAASFGEHIRVQLVVRKLLLRNKLSSPIPVSIIAGGDNPRYVFDNTLSPWLNRANKQGFITNFSQKERSVSFDIEQFRLNDLSNLIPLGFELKYD